MASNDWVDQANTQSYQRIPQIQKFNVIEETPIQEKKPSNRTMSRIKDQKANRLHNPMNVYSQSPPGAPKTIDNA